MIRYIIAAVLAFGLSPALPASADQTFAPSSQPVIVETVDESPGCVDWHEYSAGTRTKPGTKRQFNAAVHSRGVRVPNRDEEAFDGERLGNPKRFQWFDYTACNGATMYVVFEKKNRYHPNCRIWWFARYTDAGFGESLKKR